MLAVLLTSERDPSQLLAAIGILMTGLASLITAVLSVRVTRRRLRSECDERIKELAAQFREGLRFADERPLRRIRARREREGPPS